MKNGVGMVNRGVVCGVLAALFICNFAAPGLAQIRIDVPEPGGAGLPIAIAPLKNQNGEGSQRLGEDFADIVARDLDLSGLFRPIDRAAYIEGPEGLLFSAINFHNWSMIGALALVKGGFWIDDNSLIVEARLFDVAQRKELGGKRYRGERKDLRRMAHRFADHVMLLLTGEAGPFSAKIAFVSNRGGRAKELFVTDLTGTEIVQVTKDRRINLGPSWNPTGSALTYISYKQGGPYPYRLDLFSGQGSRLSSMVGYSSRWSPDGSMIAASLEQGGDLDLFLLSPEGSTIRHLTENSEIDISPAWSPDGQRLAFCSNRSGSPQIYIMNINGGSIRRLTFTGNYNTSPAWSPKGDLIAYTSRLSGFRIMSIRASGGEPHEVAAGEDPSWSPDGRYLVFSSRGRLRIASKDGRSVKQLTGGGGDDTSPAWSARLE
ncbi:MAG: Tol-Pal system beta propeller repeat protein TolB [Deltaproteobacteria bacterium]|nr:Tol-Pal system beta propeller repeat protein TolB [Deltaproteobacteria bacterium]